MGYIRNFRNHKLPDAYSQIKESQNTQNHAAEKQAFDIYVYLAFYISYVFQSFDVLNKVF